MPNWLSQTLRIALIVALPLAIVLTNVRLLMLPWFPDLEYNQASFPPDFNVRPGTEPMTREQRSEWAKVALAYIVSDAPPAFLGDLQFPNGEPLYDARELRHMIDVQVVTRWALRVWLLSLIIVGGASFALGRNLATRALWRSGLTVGALIVVGALLAVMLYILLNFNSFFTQFHQVFFEGGTWLFRFDDTLIRLFPLKFWSDAFTLIGIASLLEGAALWFAAWRFLR